MPCTEVDPLGPLMLDHPESTGAGAGGAEGVRSPSVIANSKGEREELVAEAAGGDNSSGALG